VEEEYELTEKELEKKKHYFKEALKLFANGYNECKEEAEEVNHFQNLYEALLPKYHECNVENQYNDSKPLPKTDSSDHKIVERFHRTDDTQPDLDPITPPAVQESQVPQDLRTDDKKRADVGIVNQDEPHPGPSGLYLGPAAVHPKNISKKPDLLLPLKIVGSITIVGAIIAMTCIMSYKTNQMQRPRMLRETMTQDESDIETGIPLQADLPRTSDSPDTSDTSV